MSGRAVSIGEKKVGRGGGREGRNEVGPNVHVGGIAGEARFEDSC